jgi:hypothetical protein
MTPQKQAHTPGKKVIGPYSYTEMAEGKLPFGSPAVLILDIGVVFKLIGKILSVQVVAHDSQTAFKAESAVVKTPPSQFQGEKPLPIDEVNLIQRFPIGRNIGK